MFADPEELERGAPLEGDEQEEEEEEEEEEDALQDEFMGHDLLQGEHGDHGRCGRSRQDMAPRFWPLVLTLSPKLPLFGRPLPEESESASESGTESLTWISWFCSLPGHEYFAEVSEDFIEDDFNLTGLNALVPFYKEALEMILDVEPRECLCALSSPSWTCCGDAHTLLPLARLTEDSPKIPDVSIVESSAELLYGLIHQRYILTRQGLQQMVSPMSPMDCTARH